MPSMRLGSPWGNEKLRYRTGPRSPRGLGHAHWLSMPLAYRDARTALRRASPRRVPALKLALRPLAQETSTVYVGLARPFAGADRLGEASGRREAATLYRRPRADSTIRLVAAMVLPTPLCAGRCVEECRRPAVQPCYTSP